MPPLILIVDDHPVIRRGLRDLLAEGFGSATFAEADDIPSALEHVRTAPPDVAVIDVALPSGSGLELTRQILALHPNVRVLVLSMHDDVIYAERALRAGALGYMNKSRPAGEIVEAFRKVLGGEIALSQAMSDRLLRRAVGAAEGGKSPLERLSDRELEVFQLLGQGLTTREIAERLSLSVKTIETHREHIKAKLHLTSAAELSRYAVLWGRG